MIAPSVKANPIMTVAERADLWADAWITHTRACWRCLPTRADCGPGRNIAAQVDRLGLRLARRAVAAAGGPA